MTNRTYVVVVLFNGSKWIEKCFGSLLLSDEPLEVIVIDNSSDDDGADKLLQLFPEITLIKLKNNEGFGKANNIGIRYAFENGASFVFLLNQDAWIEKDTIHKLVEHSLSRPEFGVLSPIHLNGDGSALDRNFSHYIAPPRCEELYSDHWCGTLKKSPYPVEFVNAAAWLITKRCIEKVGGFNPAFFLYGEDNDYLNRVKFHGLQVGICAGATIYHDRENRPVRKYFSDHSLIMQMTLRVGICDPHGTGASSIKKKCIKQIIAGLLFLERYKVLTAIAEYRFVHTEWKRVRGYVEESKREGPAFLNDGGFSFNEQMQKTQQDTA